MLTPSAQKLHHFASKDRKEFKDLIKIRVKTSHKSFKMQDNKVRTESVTYQLLKATPFLRTPASLFVGNINTIIVQGIDV